MAKPKLKPEIKTESLVSAAPKWNVVVLNLSLIHISEPTRPY